MISIRLVANCYRETDSSEGNNSGEDSSMQIFIVMRRTVNFESFPLMSSARIALRGNF